MEDSLGHGRRDGQGSGGPHLPREPLLRKALRKQGGAGRIASSEEETRICPEAGRPGDETTRGRPRGAPFRHPPRALRVRGGDDGTLREPLHDVPRHSEARPHQEKGGRVATQRDEFLRAAWRVMVAAKVAPERLVFVDECGAHASMAPIYGYAPRGKRLRHSVPRRRGKNTTLLSSMTIHGMGPSLAVEGATTAVVFGAYVEKVLAPSLRPGQV